jgi:uncharacterized membrane protein
MEAKMSHILVITFDDENQAASVLQSLKDLQNKDLLSLRDAAIIVKDKKGKVEVNNLVEKNVKSGAAVGGFLGLVVGGLLFPVAGIALGALGGALVGKTLGEGVDKKFVSDVRDSLTPGSSAILFIISNENVGMLISALRPYNGKIFQSSFDSAEEEELRKALL